MRRSYIGGSAGEDESFLNHTSGVKYQGFVKVQARRMPSARVLLSACVLGVTVGSMLGASTLSHAETDHRVDSGPDAQLAERYAPIIMVQKQTAACGDGEPYAPASVDAVLGQPGVVLRGPDEAILREQPTAADLGAADADSYLDLPGNALSPGCDYEQWFKSTASDKHPTTYARVATDIDHPDQIALQFWLFWVYNDWNDRHEGDWEMLQIVFNAHSADEALLTAPVEVNVAQHEGSERRAWADVQRRDGRPVVFPGTGSHATYYTAHRWYGKSAASGFGCDDTRSPSTPIEPAVVMLPARVTGVDDPFAWLSFEGRWGERQPSFNNGPTGPVTKDQWAHPIEWMETEGRTSSVSIPEAGTGVTDFFCRASTRGSLLFIAFLDRPYLIAIAIAIVVGLIVFGIRRTRWKPAEPDPLDATRRNGQILRAAGKLLRRDWRRYAPISLMVLIGGVLAAVVQRLILSIPSFSATASLVGRTGGSGAIVALLAGELVTVPVAIVALTASTMLVHAAPAARLPWRSMLKRVPRSRALLPAVVIGTVVVLSPLLLPVAIYLLARWCIAPCVALRDDTGARHALRGSAKLTGGRRWPIAVLTVTTVIVATLTGPFVGTMVLLVSGASFGFVNIVSALFGAVLLPWAALVLAFLHGSLTASELPNDHRAAAAPA